MILYLVSKTHVELPPIRGLLRRKTRVLVTHGVGFLPEVDRIVVMKEGRVSEQGTYRELLDREGEFSHFLVQYLAGNVATSLSPIPNHFISPSYFIQVLEAVS